MSEGARIYGQAKHRNIVCYKPDAREGGRPVPRHEAVAKDEVDVCDHGEDVGLDPQERLAREAGLQLCGGARALAGGALHNPVVDEHLLLVDVEVVELEEHGAAAAARVAGVGGGRAARELLALVEVPELEHVHPVELHGSAEGGELIEELGLVEPGRVLLAGVVALALDALEGKEEAEDVVLVVAAVLARAADRALVAGQWREGACARLRVSDELVLAGALVAAALGAPAKLHGGGLQGVVQLAWPSVVVAKFAGLAGLAGAFCCDTGRRTRARFAGTLVGAL